MTNLRLVRSTELPLVQVGLFSGEPKFRDTVTAACAPKGNRPLGDRFWIFNDTERGYKAAFAISKLVVGAGLVRPDLKPLGIGGLPTNGNIKEEGRRARTVTHLTLVVPKTVALYNESEEHSVDLVIAAVNEDLYGLNSAYELPLHPSSSPPTPPAEQQ